MCSCNSLLAEEWKWVRSHLWLLELPQHFCQPIDVRLCPGQTVNDIFTFCLFLNDFSCFAWVFYTFPLPELNYREVLLSSVKHAALWNPRQKATCVLQKGRREYCKSPLSLTNLKEKALHWELQLSIVNLPLNDYLQQLSSSIMLHKGYLVLPHHTSVS